VRNTEIEQQIIKNEPKNTVITDMKRFTVTMLSMALLLMAGACSEKKKSAEAETTQDEPVGWEEAGQYFYRDSTIYGICADGSSMNTLQLITDMGDTLLLGLVHARETNRVFGGYQVGDRMAVLVNKDTTAATMVVNQTCLLGEWVTPNPIDGSSEMGFFIKDGGVAESINQSTIVYQSWRLNNGLLEIVSTRDDGGNLEETIDYQLLFLTSDSLAIKDSEGTYEYSRPVQEEDYSDLDITLDEGSTDDFIM
jgi:hypothetical protein